ncbi:hypothetical protein CASFOL_014610 [Castilleja foliolosa]|uniref:F-box associated domain-containing protein n=1 Tax=Castilleja foliolosa TaxID=1961234 RepID=A0ABD3DSH4_9LAMI
MVFKWHFRAQIWLSLREAWICCDGRLQRLRSVTESYPLVIQKVRRSFAVQPFRFDDHVLSVGYCLSGAVLLKRHCKRVVLFRQAEMTWIWAEQLSKLRRERSCWNGEAAAEAKSWVLAGFSAGSVQPLIAFHQPREFNFLRIGLYNFSILNVYSICRSPPRKMYPQIELVGLHLD